MTAREWLDAVEAEDGMTSGEKKAVIAALRAVLDLADRRDGRGSDYMEWDTVVTTDDIRAAIDAHLGGAS